MTERIHLQVKVHLPLGSYNLEVDFEGTHQVTGVFGPSGSGKTSLLESVAGLRRRAKGFISLGNRVWLDSERGIFKRPEKRGIGYVSQKGLLFPHQDVKQNLLSGAARAEQNGINVNELLETVVDLLEIKPLLPRTVVTLSSGERQRVALGRAICSGPQLLLLDEPLSSLDIGLRRRVLPFLRRVRTEFDIPLLLVSHDPIEVQALCDDLIVLREGTVIARGEPQKVLTNPTVFPLAEREGFENILSGRLIQREGETSVVRLGREKSKVEMITPKLEGELGDEILVSVPAHDIFIATEPPQYISARNILPATVESIRSVENFQLITTSIDPEVPKIVVEVTSDAIEELAITPERKIYLIIKTSSITNYGGNLSE